VFVIVSDPVGAGFVADLPRPGGNITGLTNIAGATLVGKWLEMLKGDRAPPQTPSPTRTFNNVPQSGRYRVMSGLLAY
jgi:hypothetical protein